MRQVKAKKIRKILKKMGIVKKDAEQQKTNKTKEIHINEMVFDTPVYELYSEYQREFNKILKKGKK